MYLGNNDVYVSRRIYFVLLVHGPMFDYSESQKEENADKSVYTIIKNNVSSRASTLLILLKRGGRKRARIARSKAILIYSHYIRHRKAFYQHDGARFYSGVLIDDSLPSPSASGFPGRSQRDLPIYHVVLVIEPKPTRAR